MATASGGTCQYGWSSMGSNRPSRKRMRSACVTARSSSASVIRPDEMASAAWSMYQLPVDHGWPCVSAARGGIARNRISQGMCNVTVSLKIVKSNKHNHHEHTAGQSAEMTSHPARSPSATAMDLFVT